MIAMDSVKYIELHYDPDQGFDLLKFYKYFCFSSREDGEAEFTSAIGFILVGKSLPHSRLGLHISESVALLCCDLQLPMTTGTLYK